VEIRGRQWVCQEERVFDVGIGEMVVLAVLALVIFGDKLPSVAAQAGRTLRQLRTMANSAKEDLREGLGPEFKDFDPADLNPRRFVQKHLFEDLDDPLGLKDEPAAYQPHQPYKEPALAYGDRPPFDKEAT
jgi:sec-independent protein translocase protein TatB